MANLTNSAKLIEEVEKKVNSSSLATVATSGSYADLSNKPTIPTVNDSTITVQKNGANVGSFTTNAAAGKTINIQLAKADVGLGNVDNTSDANKPISTATQTALNKKQDKLTPGTGITIDASNKISTTALPGTTKYGASLDLSIDDTTFVITAQLKDQDGNNLGTPKTIDLPLESVVVSGSYDSATKKVILTLKDGSTVDFSVADLISGLQSEITSTNKLNADLVDDTSSAHKFVSATEKSTWNGKQAALTIAQLNAVNSGITSAKVSTYDGYATTIGNKANISDVLTKTNAATFTPTNDYNPATKKYVDDNKTEYNAGEGIEIKNWSDYSAMQGPAPSGFHVPLTTEWQGLKTIMDGLGLTTGDNWRINLHMPFAGLRDYSSADPVNQGADGRYWSSSPWNNPSYANFLRLSSSKVTANDYFFRNVGFSVRCFKDSYVAPDSNWTVIAGTLGGAGIFWNQSEGLISITSNGTTGYTIQDKNLGATTVYSDGATLSEANCGKYYQWGNNYGFPWTGSVTESRTQVDASSYGPGNYYSSSTFIKGSNDWSSVHNDNLRGAETGVITFENVITNTGVFSVNGQTGDVTVASPDMSNYLAKDNTTSFTPTGDYQPATKKYVDDNAGTGAEYNAGDGILIGDVCTSTSDMQGPAPEGFHIPTKSERDRVESIMELLSLSNYDNYRIYLHMPYAGARDLNNASVRDQGSSGMYWSCEYEDTYNHFAYSFYLNPAEGGGSIYYDNEGYSIRAFKNEYVSPNSSWTVIYGDLGGAGIFWNQTEGLISITNGTTGCTMMDKNLGATNVYSNRDTLSEANCGKYYQWGNNYGFPWTGSVITSSTQVDPSGYGPGNYYYNNVFVTGNGWTTTVNTNLWGGVSKGSSQVCTDNVITNTGVLSVNGQTGNVTIASPDMSNYLAKDNTIAYTPTGDYQPATKKYVDDNAGTGGEQNLFIITEDMVTVSTDATKGVAPYNTSYGYTNIDINANAGIEWKEGAIYTFVVDTKMVVASTYRNVRVRIGNGAYIPVMGTTAAAAGNSYFVKTNIRQFQYTTKYESGGALHVFTDSNTTYSSMSASEANTGTATSARTISASVLKGAITTHAPVKSVNGATGAVTVQSTISDLSTIRTNATNGATVVSGDSGKNYVIKVSTTAPASGTASNVITIVTD